MNLSAADCVLLQDYRGSTFRTVNGTFPQNAKIGAPSMRLRRDHVHWHSAPDIDFKRLF
jgi:hypothetical protein